MAIQLTAQQSNAIFNTLSHVRMSTYLAANGFSTIATPLDIYIWNSSISSAFFSVLQVCEVAVRNGVANALQKKYGASWPWNPNFEKTLKKSMKTELIKARTGQPVGSSGKVVAELKFHFWCQMFTSSQDQHIWNAHLRTEFPNLPFPLTVSGARELIYKKLDAVRKFRNRIAHHEPIIAYNLHDNQSRIMSLIHHRCFETQQWLIGWECVTATLQNKP